MSDKKRTILVIDDEKDLVDAISFQLKAKKGYEVIAAYNGAEGLEKLKDFKPDLIILDINMPKVGGIEFYRNICDRKGKAKYPVLVLTARTNLEQLFKEINVDGFMPKPFEFDHLFEEMDIIIQKRHEKAKSPEPAIKKESKKVLVVEDNQAVFDKIAVAFLNAGYLVNLAKSGLATIDKIVADTPDLIVIKLWLPDLSGDVVIAKLKQMPKTMDIAYILYVPKDDPIDLSATEKICQVVGIEKIVKSDEAADLLKEAKLLLGKGGLGCR